MNRVIKKGRPFYFIGLLCTSGLMLLASNRLLAGGSGIEARAELFFQKPALSDVSLSPDGTHLAYLAEHGGNQALFVYDIEAKKGIGYSDHLHTDVSSYHWIGPKLLWGVRINKHLPRFTYGYLFRSAGSFIVEAGQPHVQEWPRQSPVGLSDPVTFLRGFRFIDPLRNVPKEVILRSDNTYYRVNPLKDGLVRIGEVENHLQWMHFSPTSGAPRTRLSDDLAGTIVLEFLDATSEWKPIEIGSGWIEVLGLMNDQVLLIGTHDGDETIGIGFVNLETGEIAKPLMRNPMRDTIPLRTIWDHKTGSIAGIVFNAGQTDDVFWLNPEFRQIAQALKKVLPEQCIIIHGQMAGTDDILVEAYSDTRPVTLYRLDLKTASLTPFLAPLAHLSGLPMATREPVTFPARDGTSLHGYLLKPAGRTGPAPLVITLMDGPNNRLEGTLNLQSQYLASLGYSVIELAYRGNLGFGRSYQGPARDLRHPIKYIGTDAADAARWAVNAGHAPVGQVAVFGSGLGGFGAYSAAIEDPDAFRCVITAMGTFDWGAAAKFDRRRKRSGYSDMIHSQVQQHPQFFADYNLIDRASEVSVPTLILTDGMNRQVDTTQSRRLHRARSKHSLPGELKILPWVGHGFTHPKEQIEYYRTLGEFLHNHLAPVQMVLKTDASSTDR